MNWKQATKQENNTYQIPENWIWIHYFEALNILFRIENALRIFVYVILKDNYLEKWQDINITSDDGESSTISAIAKKRIAQSNDFAYLGYKANNPLLYLTGGELIKLITSDSNNYWKLFKDYFPGKKEIMKNKLDEIGNIRNSLAHFRPIRRGDIDLIKQNAAHTVGQIEKCLFQLTQCPDIVPTNNLESWYSELKTISAENLPLAFHQSNDKKWVKISLKFTSTILGTRRGGLLGGRPFIYRVTRLNLNNVLKEFPEFTKHLLFASELLSSSLFNSEKPIFNKTIYFVFSKNRLQENHAIIKKQLMELIQLIGSETDLIKSDNLAKGKIIDNAEVYARSDKDKPQYQDWPSLRTISTEDNVPEFWNNFTFVTENFISDSDSYPWLPVEISETSIPF